MKQNSLAAYIILSVNQCSKQRDYVTVTVYIYILLHVVGIHCVEYCDNHG